LKEEVRVFTGGLNKDDDPRFVPNGDWIDALNVSIANQEGVNGNIVAEIGAEQISLYQSTGSASYSLPSGTNTSIGSVDDPVRGHTYWFVHNSNDKHVILRYEYTTNIARLVWQDNSYANNYNPYNSDFQGAYSSSTAYSKGEIVLDSGTYYRAIRANYLEDKSATAIFTTPTNTITLGLTPHYFKTGDEVVTSAAIGGISAGTYYVIRVTSATIQLANTFADAIDGNAIEITGTLSGTPTISDSRSTSNQTAWVDISNTLNFDLNYPITHGLVIQQNDKVYLLWTDNNEQPSIMEVTDVSPTQSQYPYIERKFLDLYAFQPQHPIVCSYGTDSSKNSNSTVEKAFQFRYAWKYRDGRTTALSPISRIPLPTKYYYSDITEDNKVDLEIPVYHNETNNYVNKILLYVKSNGDNNTGDWYLAEEIDVSDETIEEQDSPYSDRYMFYIDYEFTNEGSRQSVPVSIQDQIQDFIPLKSATMTSAGSGRILLGNNTDGRDFDVSNLDMDFDPITTVAPSNLASNTGAKGTHKKTCRYPYGIIYGDRSGRITNVLRKDDMYLNSPYWNEANRGEVMCKMTIRHDPPSWAEFWMPVFGGNQTMDSWVQSAIAAVSDPSMRLEDPNEYADKIEFPSYTYTFANGQYVRVIEDYSASKYMPSSNGISQVQKQDTSEPFQIDTNGFTDFTTNPTALDMVEVFSKSNLTPDSSVWYEMGWSFKIETDKNGNKVHGGQNSFYTNVDSYTDTTFSISSISGGSSDILNIGSNSLTTGDAILYKDSSGGITGLTDNTVYYVIENTSTSVKLATSVANAILGTSITGLTGGGSGSYLVGENSEFNTKSQIIGSGSQDCVVVIDQADAYSIDIDFYEQSQAYTPMIEIRDLFPFKNSDIDTKGRPNSINPDYGEVKRIKEIVYSEPTVDQTNFFGVNRFFDVNFSSDLNNNFGAINILSSTGEDIICVQETKTARILANKNMLFTASGNQSLDVQSDVFLSQPQYFSQEFGCQNPESFAEYSGVRFWVDRLKGAVLRCAGSQIENIGQIKMSTYFEQNLPYPYPYNDNADGNNNKIYGGYSIRDNSYYITMDSHDIVKRQIENTSGTEYDITFSDLDVENGVFDRLVSLGVVPVKSTVSSYDEPWFGVTVTDSDSTSKTITVDGGVSLGTIYSVAIYVPYVDTLSFSNDRGRWISLHDFKPEWIGSSANSLCTFSGGKIYVHQLSIYTTDFFGENFNYCRFYEDVYGVYEVYNSFLEFPFNKEPNRSKEPITVWTDSNQVYSIDYAVNNDGQITETALGDYEEFEGAYWSPIFRDKTTSVVPYPLLEGDEMKGKYLKVRLKTVTNGAQQSSISSTTLKYNNSNLT
jgi:hypothetical protein